MPVSRDERLVQLRVAIGRNRRQIDRRFRATADEANRLRSWKTYVRWLPGGAMTAAFGLGLVLSVGLGRKTIRRWFGARLMRRAWAEAGTRLWAEVAKVFTASSEPAPTRAES